jgi:hypothetical protein
MDSNRASSFHRSLICLCACLCVARRQVARRQVGIVLLVVSLSACAHGPEVVHVGPPQTRYDHNRTCLIQSTALLSGITVSKRSGNARVQRYPCARTPGGHRLGKERAGALERSDRGFVDSVDTGSITQSRGC